MTKYSSTPYDDVFRTLLNDCSKLILPVINEAFGENYTGNERIEFRPNEFFAERNNGEEDKTITDTNFLVISREEKYYHWECESKVGNVIMIRFFQYDSQIALKNGQLNGDTFEARFPSSAVLFLRSTSTTPDRLHMKIIAPDRQSIMYDIPVMKVKRYGIGEIFEKKLYLLIPFYLFTYESKMKRLEENEEDRTAFAKEYEYIRDRLEEAVAAGEINDYTNRTICEMTAKVATHLAIKYDTVREDVTNVMSGRVLDYEAKRIKNEGEKKRGNEDAMRMLSRGYPIEDVAFCSGLTVSEVLNLKTSMTPHM